METKRPEWKIFLDGIERSLEGARIDIDFFESLVDPTEGSDKKYQQRIDFVDRMRRQLDSTLPELLVDIYQSEAGSEIKEIEEEYLKRVQLLAVTDKILGYDLARGFAETYNQYQKNFSEKGKHKKIVEYGPHRFGIVLE
jgi:hypothetical protein